MEILDSVLLVDDDESANFFHRNLIQNMGVAREIVEAGNGRQAIRFIEENYYGLRQLPSLVLLDLAMPEMDGIELIRQLKSSNLLAVNKIPLAVVTISTSEKDQKAVHELGDFIYVTKPLNEAKFLDIIKTAVVPTLLSSEKRRHINELQKELEQQMGFLKQQHQWLKERQKEIIQFTSEIREKIRKFRNDD